MYTKKNFRDELYQICQNQYVKYRLLEDFTFGRINQQAFVDQISSRKSTDEVRQVLVEVSKVQQKVQQNGGKFDEDPVAAAQGLRKSGKLQEAFNVIVPYIKQNASDEYANSVFGWIMYEYFKASEQDPETYSNNLKVLNDLVQFDFGRNNDEYIITLLNSILWSIRRVVMQGELAANKVFGQFRRFVGNSPLFIEQRGWGFTAEGDGRSPSRLLIKEFCSKLNENNYFSLFDMVGFDWFDSLDYETSSFTGKDGETVEVKPLAETTLGDYAKKLIQANEPFATRDRISAFISKLTSVINSHAEYEWLPSYRIKLLVKLGDKEQAFPEAIEFARNRGREFWVWDLISELTDGDQQFYCLCAGLLCKTKPEMIVRLQEKSIPYLVEREMCAEAKHILNNLIETRTKKGWKISPELQNMKKSSWYDSGKAASSLDGLQTFADEAKKMLYQTLPFTDAFITDINDKKGVINFAFMAGRITKEGYFYKDSVTRDFDWKINRPVKIRMIADKKRDNLFNVFAVENGSEEFASHFLKEFCGIFEKVKDFGFIRDTAAELFVNPVMLKENNLKPFSKVSGMAVKKWDRKKSRWGWQIISIGNVEEPDIADFEREISDGIKIASKGFGFVDGCFVSEDLIRSSNLRENDFVRAKAQKSWDKGKSHWSWRVTEIIGTTQDDESASWGSEIAEVFDLKQEQEDDDYRKWVEDGLHLNSEDEGLKID